MDDNRAYNLIVEVQKYGLLYDPSDKFHKDNKKKGNSWTEISTNIHEYGMFCY